MAVQQVEARTVHTMRADYVEFTGERYEDAQDRAESILNELVDRGQVVTWMSRGCAIGMRTVTVKYLVIRPEGVELETIGRAG